MSSCAPGTPSQRTVNLYDDTSHHGTDDDTIWTYNGCTFKRITKKEIDGNIVELRNGGVLSCPICPEIGVMTTLSNLVGHLVAKNHAQRFYHLWSLRGSGNNNAGPMLLFQESWEAANHLKILRSKRLEKVDKVVLMQNDYTWDQLKTRFNCVTESPQGEGESIQEQLLMPGLYMFQNFQNRVGGQPGGEEWNQNPTHQARLIEARTYNPNRNISTARNAGQQIVTSVFRQAKDKVTGLKGPLSEITDNPRKRRIFDEDQGQDQFNIPKRPHIGGESDIIMGQGTNSGNEQQGGYESLRDANTLSLQFPWTDEQVAEAKALKAKLANSEKLTPQEQESYRKNHQLYFLMDTFQGMEKDKYNNASCFDRDDTMNHKITGFKASSK